VSSASLLALRFCIPTYSKRNNLSSVCIKVLEGLESYIATTQFLHTLEQASAEWIDLSEHQHPTKNLQHGSVELMQVWGSLFA
jgi:hypothetical protein